MLNKLKRIARKLKSFMPVMRGISNVTFSQYGEDIIMLKMLEKYNVKNITYLDIGANDPVNSNNTYNFYLRKNYGVLVEPNAELCRQIKSKRPHDKVLNYGIGNNNITEADYYSFGEKYSGHNTFSKENAQNSEKEGIPVKNIIKLPLKNVNDVIAENFTEAPTVISLDVEGLDELILEELDFNKYHPLLICVETVTFSAHGELKKRENIFSLMESKGYFVYADTHVNTIFCSRKLFKQLSQN